SEHQVQARTVLTHHTIVSWPPDTPDTVHASRHTSAATIPKRTHRQRHDTTSARQAAATVMTPSSPEGTESDPPGTAAAHRATCNNHHSSGPVNRISRSAPAGQSAHNAAAPVPTTVMGGITAATARLAATDTTLKVPDIPATSGAVTSCAATATHTASARGLGQP